MVEFPAFRDDVIATAVLLSENEFMLREAKLCFL